jgi:menaquinone-dependent protoporphyrinogen oxidase
VVNAKEDKVQSISDYELIIVGSGIRMGRWTKEPEEFLEEFQKEPAKKKLALFVCECMQAPLPSSPLDPNAIWL